MYKWIRSILLLTTMLSIVVFLCYWLGTRFSTNISDWGSFADYISGIPLSIITLLLVVETYRNQKEYNKIIQFENVFFKMYLSVKIQNVVFATSYYSIFCA